MGTVDPHQIAGFGFADFDARSAVDDYEAPQLSLVPAGSRMGSWRYQHAKRAIDVLGSVAGLALCLLPGLAIAAAIAITSPGPIFYREDRIGRGGRTFQIWKFRSMDARPTMHAWLDAQQHFEMLSRLRTDKDVHDPRITTIGRILRKWSLDELPQLINVLLGEMSLVGPRPVVEGELRLYEHLVSHYLEAVPGMSGLWQVSGRSNVAFSARARLDATYVRSWSLLYDMTILARTIPAVLRRVGAR